MAPRKQQAPRRPMTFPITVVGLIAAATLCAFGFPGMAAVWFAALLISITHPPAVLTGPRVGGVVTAAHEGEEARVRKHREVTSRKSGLITLSDLWRPSAPFGKGEHESLFPQWSWLTAVLAGLAAAFALPAHNLDGTPNPIFAAVNGLSLATVVATYAATRRRFMTTAPDGSPDPCPGVRVDSLIRYAIPSPVEGKGHPVAVLVAVLASGLVSWVVVDFALGLAGGLMKQAAATGLPVLERLGAPSTDLVTRLPLLLLVWWGGVTLLLWTRPLFVLAGDGLRDFAIGGWLLRLEARREWAPRFDELKLPGTPVVSRKKVGPALLDTFRPATGKTIADYLKVAPQVPKQLGDGYVVTVLQVPSEQMPGQFHPSEFEVVTWPVAEAFDFNTAPATSGDPEQDHDLLVLATRVALARYADAAQAPRVILEEVSLVSQPPQPEVADDEEPQEIPAEAVPAPVAPVQTDPNISRVAAPRPAPARGIDPNDPNSVAEAIFSGGEFDPFATEEPFESRVLHTVPTEDPFIYSDEEPHVARPAKSRTLRKGAAQVGGALAASIRKIGPALARTASTASALADRLRRDDAEDERVDITAEGSPVVYRVLILGGNYAMLKVAHLGALADGFGSEALVDDGRLSQQAPAVYVGAISDSGIEFAPDTGVTHGMLENIRQEAWWTPKWAQSLKTSIKPPDWHFAGHLEARLADGTLIKREGFQVKQGDHPEKFFDAESGVRTALSNAAFCSITAWPGVRGTRPGERDPGTLALWYADSGAQIPMSPDTVVPPAGPTPPAALGRPGMQRRRRPDFTAEQAVLAWLTNRAFEDQRLKRPEVVSVEPVTSSRSPRHIWKIRVRFYGGVTLSDVRSKADNIRSAYGVPWLRVMPADDGCIIVAGCKPEDAVLVDGDRTQAFLESLDLEQAFLDAGVRGKGGFTPTLIEQSVMPRNPDVRVLDYRLPAGVDLNQVRSSISRLRTNTNMDFMSAFPGKHGAASIRMLMAKEDPMPFPVGYDWDYDHSSGEIAFGTGVDGEYAIWDIKETPHMALVGGSGYGKSVSAQVFITGLLLYGAHVMVGDAQKFCADFQFAEDWTMCQAKSVHDVRAMLEATYAESKRRARLNGDHGVGHVKDLPAHLRPKTWVVLLDEFEGLIETAGKPSRTVETDPELEKARLEMVAEYEAKQRIAYLAGRIFAESRSADVHIIVMTQKLVVAKLPPSLIVMKTNAGRAIVGKTTFGDRQSALRDAENAPDIGEEVPKGRGIWESMESPAVACQWWYAGQDELKQGLVAAGVEPGPRLDLDQHRPAGPGEQAKFAVIDEPAAPARAVVVDEAAPVTDDWLAVPLVSGDPEAGGVPVDGDWGEEMDLGDFALDDDGPDNGSFDLGEVSIDDVPERASAGSDLEDFDLSFDTAEATRVTDQQQGTGSVEPTPAVGGGWLSALASAAGRLPAHVEPDPQQSETPGVPAPDTQQTPADRPVPTRRPRRKPPRLVPLPVFDEEDEDDEQEDVSLGGMFARRTPARQPSQSSPDDGPFGSVAGPSHTDGPF